MTEKALKPGRPFLFKILFFSLVLIALSGWMRVSASIYQWNYLLKYQVKPGPGYSLFYGLMMGLFFTAAALLFWLKHKSAKRFLQIGIPLFFAWWWLDYLLFSKTTVVYTDLPFRIFTTIISLSFVYLYLRFSKHV